MPIREFKCRKCGAVFEELCLRKDEKVRCPKCGGKKLDLLFSPFSLSGKGGSVSSCASCRSTNCAKCR
uniref:Zinc ribbon domain-containing protein n=1 Tax=candidate division WOR-3 bacterium TaxID=2052148 RepID=A0A7C3YSK7_UNCW3